MRRLDGRVAVVTGGGQGIGKGIAARFLAEGARVVLAEVDMEAGREAEAELGSAELGSAGASSGGSGSSGSSRGADSSGGTGGSRGADSSGGSGGSRGADSSGGGGGEVFFVRTDVADEESVREMVRAAVARFGRIDILVNNAGIAHNAHPSVLSLADWNRVIGVNLTGPFLCAKHAAPHMTGGGAIVNIASTRALMSEANTEAYSASKGGIVALTHALSVSLGPAVRVNCISPGWIEVGDWKKAGMRRGVSHSDADRLQHPAGRVGRPEDIAAMAVYLACEESGFITGQNFVIDGGMTKKMIYV